MTQKSAAQVQAEHEAIMRDVHARAQAFTDKRQETSMRRAHEVARLVLHLRHAQEPVSRRRMLALGLSSDWFYSLALAMLRTAGLEAAPVGTIEELGAALASLEETSARLLAAGAAGFDELRSHATKRQERRRYVQAGGAENN